MSAIIVLGQMIVLFSMMIVGFISYKKGVLSDETAGQMSKLVINVFNPLLIINSVLSPLNDITSKKLWINLSMVGIYFVILFICGYLTIFILRPKIQQRSMYLLMVLFSNVGFMGIPVAQSIYGKTAVAYVAFYMLIYNIILYTVGNYLAERSAEEFQGKKLFSHGNFLCSIKKILNPGVFASVIAILILVSKLQVPSFIVTFCDYMGNITIPVSMILIGVSVAQMNIKQFVGDIKMYGLILLKMIIFPILIIFVFRKIPIDTTIFGVFILEMSMPVGNIVTLMAKEKGADVIYCSKGIILSTLASIITIPIICLFI